jgi:hypothetical protein
VGVTWELVGLVMGQVAVKWNTTGEQWRASGGYLSEWRGRGRGERYGAQAQRADRDGVGSGNGGS